ncbi:hypothetical protein [Roseovarius atlanticus]|uniref:hypothetical protein n=1 Tax=Roseovarius atlanticus TaxID=1641875 RepID=UPI001C938115|nr:hypothetical protein [Roseovarius atlanticus]MBY5988687.1 hypothetical protein [Roseovarius atlanticus]MBY6124078.1 hypothetical protein [Roseovarius atlanticus]MBY6148573.1 hypothetical protein [Roseovarius atlanticus]
MLSSLSHEGQASVTVVTCLAVAYFMIYPALRPRRASRMAVYDLGVTGVMLLVNGWLFGGTGTRFSLWLFDTNWVVFTIVVALVIETPLMLWYVRRNGMTWD